MRPQFGFYKNKKTGIEANLSEKSVNKISSEKAIEKSKANGFTVEEHFEVAERIAELYENADLAETSPDKKGSLDLKSIKRFDSEVTLSDGKKAVAHITVKESVQNGYKIYSVEVYGFGAKKVPLPFIREWCGCGPEPFSASSQLYYTTIFRFCQEKL